MRSDDLDLGFLREMWRRRRQRAAAVRRRTDPHGMTRPARDADEREVLRESGGTGPFREVEMPGWREWREGTRRDPSAGAEPPSD